MFLALALMIAGDTPAATAQPEKKICRWAEAATGSNMPGKKTCMTKSEWALAAKENQKNADRYRNDRATGNGVPNLKAQ